MNNNIEESYCSYPVSKLLEQKGMNIKSINRYIDEHGGNGKGIRAAMVTDLVQQPTHAVAVEWLRVNFGIQLFLDYNYYDGFHYGYKWVKYNGDYGEYWKDNDDEPAGWDSPQEATEAALLYTLKNLI